MNHPENKLIDKCTFLTNNTDFKKISTPKKNDVDIPGNKYVKIPSKNKNKPVSVNVAPKKASKKLLKDQVLTNKDVDINKKKVHLKILSNKIPNRSTTKRSGSNK